MRTARAPGVTSAPLPDHRGLLVGSARVVGMKGTDRMTAGPAYSRTPGFGARSTG